VSTDPEVYISVDVESAGPIPGEYSLLAIGACRVDRPQHTFACELKPLNRNADPRALEVTGLSLEDLDRRGLEPAEAMQRFAVWLAEGLGPDNRLVFVGLNAPFDWSFVNYYFHRFVGRNPFGFAALDIKSFYMGVTGCIWADTRSSQMAKVLRPRRTGDHDALHDAQYQAELFRLIRDRTRRS
jgi:DNA polymerase III epsilon subunit-like protein